MLIQPVVLSGGSGTRLWPLSREKYPKQLLPLIGEDSLLQATVRRVEGIAGLEVAAPLVVCNEEYRFVIAEQLRVMGKPGTVVFFDCNILHASGHNLSQHNRWAIYVVYNPVTNRCRDVPNPRPDYVRSTNTKPLFTGSDHIFPLASSTQEAR